MKKKKTSSIAIISLAAALIIGVTAGLVWLLSGNGKEEYTYVDISTSSSYIDCMATQPKDAFFYSDLSSSTSQKIKITFSDDEVDKIAYTYTGVFPNPEIAKEESARMTFDYNTYMGQQTSYDRSVLSPAFSPIENKLIVNLFMSKKYFDDNTAKLVFLTPDEYSGIKENEGTDSLLVKLEKAYESKLFTCEVKN